MCPYSIFLSKEDCGRAGLALGGSLLDREVKKVSLSSAPFGCSIDISAGAGYILYNSSRGKNDGNYQSVCSKGSFTLLPRTYKGGCPSLMNVSKDNCEAAGLSIGGKMSNNGKMYEGSWSHVPFGCSIGGGSGRLDFIHYNSDTNGKNNGYYASLCHELPVSDVDSS
jgi:hypothetical protein